MKIPTFEEAKQALIEKRGTPMDKFVAYWEPMPPEDEKFREMLAQMIDFAVTESNKPEQMECEVLYPANAGPWSFWNPSTNQYEEKQ